MEIEYERIGERIRKVRKGRKYTQARLAEEADLSTEYLCEIENGKKRASLYALAGIAEALGVTVDEMLYGECRQENYLRVADIVLKDCSEYERHVLCENMKGLKRILRDAKS